MSATTTTKRTKRAVATSTIVSTPIVEKTVVKFGNADDKIYDKYLLRIQQRFLDNVALGPLFTTDADNLFNVYVNNFATAAEQQHHNCHACRDFLRRFGGLVAIQPDGTMQSAIWDEKDTPAKYKPSVRAMLQVIRRAKVTGVFLSSEEIWGRPETGPWRHFALVCPEKILFKSRVLTADQAAAEKLEDYRNLARALAEYPSIVVNRAIALLKTDSLYRSEKCLGVAEWLLKLHTDRQMVRGKTRDNILWHAVATAPAGYCHPRSSMIGTLLDDIASGMDFDDVKRRFDAKMHPLQYQRPQAAPSSGNIAQAETLVKQMGIAPALKRRFACLEEIETLWRPRQRDIKSVGQQDGVFAHLKAKDRPSLPPTAVNAPPVVITWDKFLRTGLPEAEKIEYSVPYATSNFAALLTAVDPDAPPILQWDSQEQRNPFSWYLWAGGSLPSQWGLVSGTLHKVTAVSYLPQMWKGNEDRFEHQGKGVIFLLDGARDTQTGRIGLALFPEILKSELRAVRSTIEAYSQSGKLEDGEEASACGILLQKGGNWNAQFRVTSNGMQIVYKLDRWD
jgi:hypothetical protein